MEILLDNFSILVDNRPISSGHNGGNGAKWERVTSELAKEDLNFCYKYRLGSKVI